MEVKTAIANLPSFTLLVFTVIIEAIMGLIIVANLANEL